jgi:hypothetical protein
MINFGNATRMLIASKIAAAASRRPWGSSQKAVGKDFWRYILALLVTSGL